MCRADTELIVASNGRGRRGDGSSRGMRAAVEPPGDLEELHTITITGLGSYQVATRRHAGALSAGCSVHEWYGR